MMKRARALHRTWPLALALAALLTACSTDCEACHDGGLGGGLGPEALDFRLCLTQAPDAAPAANLCLDVTLPYTVTN
jgi:hypothetical protein